MKKARGPVIKSRRSRSVVQESSDIRVADDWAIVAGSRRGPRRHAIVPGSGLTSTAVARGPLAFDEHTSPPGGLAEAITQGEVDAPVITSVEGGSTIEMKLARLVGADKRVLLAGHGLEAVRRELLGSGCRVQSADTHADPPGEGPHHGRMSRPSDGAEIGRKLGKQRFDVIALRHVLEYAHDPIGLLARLRTHLTADGYVVAAIPNITHGSIRLRLLAGQSPNTWATFGEPPARFYDGASARRLFERAGLTITRFERHTEAFEGAVSALNGTALPSDFLTGLMRNADALTSAFVVVAHARPLTGRTSLDLRMREFADRQLDHRRMLDDIQRRLDGAASRDQIEGLVRQLEALSIEATGLTRAVDAWQDEGHLASLRRAHDTLVARGADVSAIVADVTRLAYEQLVARFRAAVERVVPSGAHVLVVSKGDEQLLRFSRRTGSHFLQTTNGVYAGHHPKDSAAAIDALNRLRAKGAHYLALPETAFWWLDHYADFKDSLNRRFKIVLHDPRTCLIYALKASGASR